MPRSVAVAIGSLGGAAIGIGIAAWATAQLVDEMSLEPYLDGWVWIPASLLAVNVATSIAVTAGLIP